HLMISHPENYIEKFRAAGADIITVHQEACTHLDKILQSIRATGAKAGVAINPATPVNVLVEIIESIDLLLIMSVNPGFGGQKFIPNSLKKIRDARKLIDASGLRIDLEVDGGVDSSNSAFLKEAGATVLVAGTAIFHSKNIPAALNALRS
ncbi:MAG: ribulose-phosphate 3-epimerase, partial [Ignavibacteriales bacterium]|nr:ribulose-phosphate 3-epimerase [Ignavibacteriales bacterium]